MQKHDGMRYTLLYVLTLLLFTTCTTKPKNENSILDFVPKTSSILLKINDFESLREGLSSNEILGELESTRIYSKISDKIHPLEFLSEKKKGLLAFSVRDSVDFDFTFITTDSLSFIDWEKSPNKTIESLSYKNANVTKYQINKELFYTVYLGGHAILSSSLNLLKNLIDIPVQENINPSLDRFYTISNPQKALNIWIDLEHGEPLFNQLFLNDHKLSDFASWMSLDLSLNDTEILLNGITQTDTVQNNFLNLFNDSNPIPNKVSALIPRDVRYLKSYTLDDFKTFSKNKISNHIAATAMDSVFTTVEEIGVSRINNETILILRTYGTASLLDYITEDKIDTEEYGGNEIWELNPDTKIFKPIESLLTGSPSFKYASIIENNFLFAESKAVLQRILNDYKSGDVFGKTDLYKNADHELTSSASVLTVSDLDGTVELLEASVSNRMAKIIGDIDLKNYVFGSQFIADKGFFHSNFLIKKIVTTADKNTVSSVFEVQFSTDLSNSPQFVTNHYNGKKEILVQDQANILYLISPGGKIIWEKQLEGTVQGKVHQVDLFKNGKQQLAFTTNNEFLILDRNGKEVAPFSMKFEGGNLNPLAVFDYERKNEYRFLVTQNKKVFMYNNKGNIVKGFKYDTAEANILEAPQHFRIGRKDYLVFKLDNGQLRILNRVGDTRIKVKDKLSFSENPVQLYQNKFTFTSTDGRLYQIDTKGAISQSNSNLVKDHGIDATSKTLAIMNDNVLQIRDKKVELELGVYSKPTIFYLNDKIYVSVSDIQNQKVYLFDSQAEAIPNFPIYGNSIVDMADIDNDKNLELVVKDQENSIKVYRIN
ncbi:ribonuclease HII [Maribacter sp. X9]|uniref:ribonuclease HII n=1 Tax=Maribacter sp. X9 TaxID=3402159 RepID=UPI003AF39A68